MHATRRTMRCTWVRQGSGTIDGTPGREPENDARLGRLQIVNHCYWPGNNCDFVIVTCNITFLSLYVLVSNVVIPAVGCTFPYQEPHV